MNHVDDWTKLEELGREDRALRYLAKARLQQEERSRRVRGWLCIGGVGILAALIAMFGIWCAYLRGI